MGATRVRSDTKLGMELNFLREERGPECKDDGQFEGFLEDCLRVQVFRFVLTKR